MEFKKKLIGRLSFRGKSPKKCIFAFFVGLTDQVLAARPEADCLLNKHLSRPQSQISFTTMFKQRKN